MAERNAVWRWDSGDRLAHSRLFSALNEADWLRLGGSTSEPAFWTENHPSFGQAMRQAPRVSRASARDNDDKLQRKSER